MSNTTTPTVSFTAELKKETEHAYSYRETTPKGQPPVSGGIYLKDYVVQGTFDGAEVVEVTVRKIR